MQRLAQVVTGGGQESGLAAIGFLCIRARRIGCHRLRLQFADQIQVLVADGQRVHHQVVEVVAEAQHESKHHEHHRGEECVHLVAAECNAQY